MSKKTIVILFIIAILLVLLVVGIRFSYAKRNKSTIDIGYTKNIDIDTLKADKGITASNELVEIVEEYDGRKSVGIKRIFLFEVALIDYYQKNYTNLDIAPNTIINVEELEQKYEKAENEIFVNDGGVIIPPKDQQAFLKVINDKSKCKYYCDESNYLRVSNEGNEKSEFDKIIIEMINSNSDTLILTYENDYYSIDDVTGEIVNYPYYDLDPYTEFDAIKNDNQEIRFVNSSIEGTSFLVN